MEHPAALAEGDGLYRWHSGAPDDAAFVKAWQEVIGHIQKNLIESGLDVLQLEEIASQKKSSGNVTP